MITVKQFLNIISTLDSMFYSNNTCEEKCAIETIQSLLNESAALEEENKVTTIEAILKRAESRINPSILHKLAVRAAVIKGDPKVTLDEFLKIVTYLDQITKLPDICDIELNAILTINNYLCDYRDGGKYVGNYIQAFNALKCIIHEDVLNSLASKAEKLDSEFNKNSLIALENTNPTLTALCKDFENLSDEEKKSRVNLLAEGLSNYKEQELDFNDSLRALLDPKKLAEIGTYIQEYHASIQLPFSKNILSIKILSDDTIFYRFKEGMDWLIWDGSKHSISTIKVDSFKGSTIWQRKEETKLVDEFISITYRLAHFYFKNIN